MQLKGNTKVAMKKLLKKLDNFILKKQACLLIFFFVYLFTGARGGWGTAEATEMIMNNLFYITVKFGDDHPKEVEELWAAICACWPKNLRIIIRYLFIISGLAPNELIDYSKRVLLYLGRSQPVSLFTF